jgi:hypothetical protein
MAVKIAALLNTLTLSDVESMPPAERRSFAELCRHWAQLAEHARSQCVDPHASGILADLRQGYRSE